MSVLKQNTAQAGIGKAKTTIQKILLNNGVTILFGVACAIGVIYAKQPATFLVSQVCTRLMRNLVLILSLILPVWAGLGLNFGIVLGAMSAQAGLIISLNFSLTGVTGFLAALLASFPIAAVLGALTGNLFNRTKGQEMVTGMILGYFANGVYQLIFMYLCGSVIPMLNQDIILSESVGINGTLSLDKYGIAAILNSIWEVTLDQALFLCIAIGIVCIAGTMLFQWKRRQPLKKSHFLALGLLILSGVALFLFNTFSATFAMAMQFSRLSLLNLAIIAFVCAFITLLGRTKLGHDIKAVGQSIPISKAVGINVRRIRILAVVISTVIAALGQLIYLQGLGIIDTYASHEQIGTYSVAALLVGGASTRKANIGHALLGAFLFHLMFIVAPLAGKNLFGDAQYGEYFRVFVSYAVIAVALALHTWQSARQSRQESLRNQQNDSSKQ